MHHYSCSRRSTKDYFTVTHTTHNIMSEPSVLHKERPLSSPESWVTVQSGDSWQRRLPVACPVTAELKTPLTESAPLFDQQVMEGKCQMFPCDVQQFEAVLLLTTSSRDATGTEPDVQSTNFLKKPRFLVLFILKVDSDVTVPESVSVLQWKWVLF